MNDEQLYAMRHSLAHITAQAEQHLWPEAKFGVGPVVENGFYYDIELGELTGAKAELFAEISAIANLTKTAGVKNTQVNEWLYRSLAALNKSDATAVDKLAEAAAIKTQL